MMGKTIKDFFDSGNLFILFLSLTFFFLVEIFFFLEVVTEETATIIERQAKITTDIIAPGIPTSELQATKQGLDLNLPFIEYAAASDRYYRRELLYERARETFTLPVSLVGGLTILFLLIAIFRKNLHLPDFIAVFLVAFSFTTELILYFMVLRNIDYVDDISMLNRSLTVFQEALI